ncbi:hypothetical protein MMC29_001234 [Sticta canariensis]|nr:hypothetical protein [Sticta canariensis]
MEGTTAPTPKPNEFVIPETTAYAMTDMETGEIAEFLMTRLEPVNPEYLDPDDGVCAICQQEFRVSEDVRHSHTPVMTICGHVFGKRCIIKWLQPLNCWGLKEEDNPYPEPDDDSSDRGNSSCPICRQAFVSECRREPMEFLAHRLSFWDTAYATVGVARSEKEEHTRKYLRELVEYCRSIDEHEPSEELKQVIEEGAQEVFLAFARILKNQTLTAVQENLRAKLERIGRKDLAKCAFENGAYVFDLDRDDDERIELDPRP